MIARRIYAEIAGYIALVLGFHFAFGETWRDALLLTCWIPFVLALELWLFQ